MPLNHGYGVVIGTKHHYYRDPPNDYGQYFHGNVEVATSGGIYRCAIDVDSKQQPNGVEWRKVEMGLSTLKGLTSLADGWHALLSNSTSGALDYIRADELHPKVGCVFAIFNPLFEALRQALQLAINPPWKQGTSIQALADLEPLLNSAKRLFIFGEPFTVGVGVHNIHQNQGDPLGSQWWAENGIWQDGATLIQREDGSIAAFLNKFKTQAHATDNNGHPL
ncbi:MAG: DUF2278 family protein [Planctomycetia bacterium]|nr:DUF2278 family protein [Planctomycetia bacterium]